LVKATSAIRGQDTVWEYLACEMYPLSACVSFEGITDGVTLVSRVRLPLPMFCAVRTDDEDDVQFLARAALEAESVVGGYSRPEHDACVASLPNGGRLNRVFELVGVAYGPDRCLVGLYQGFEKKESQCLEFYYSVYNQCESFIYVDLMVKNREIPIEIYFKW
jgi:hypothetical protein